MRPLRTLFEAAPPPSGLPPVLATLYGGGLGLPAEALFANFVTSLDGVVALEQRRGSGSRISGRNAADRFLMGLLRALADVILVGGGNLRAEGGQPWTAAHISPRHAAAYRELGRPDPPLAVVSPSGRVDPAEPALERGGLVLTSPTGAAALRGRLPAPVAVRVLGEPPFAGAQMLAALRAEGHRQVLCEGGPELLAALVAGGVLDELFLTLSPILAGRRPGDGRLGMVEGADLLLPAGPRPRLCSVKAHGSHLFLRYSLRAAGADPGRSRAGPVVRPRLRRLAAQYPASASWIPGSRL